MALYSWQYVSSAGRAGESAEEVAAEAFPIDGQGEGLTHFEGPKDFISTPEKNCSPGLTRNADEILGAPLESLLHVPNCQVRQYVDRPVHVRFDAVLAGGVEVLYASNVPRELTSVAMIRPQRNRAVTVN